MNRGNVAAFAWDPHPNPPPCRGRELTEFAARSVHLLWERGAASSFLPLKGGGSRWGSLPASDAIATGYSKSNVR
jgi:hypothetical protein